MLKINASRAVNQIKPSLSSGTFAWLWKGTKPKACLSQHQRISGKLLLALPIGSNSKDRHLVQRLEKESKRQKQFICPTKAQFGVEALANMIPIYFKLVGNVTQMDTTNDKSYSSINSRNRENEMWRKLWPAGGFAGFAYSWWFRLAVAEWCCKGRKGLLSRCRVGWRSGRSPGHRDVLVSGAQWSRK